MKISQLLEQARKDLGEGLIYVMTPCGIGCTINEALVHYGNNTLHEKAYLERKDKTIELKWPLKNGKFGSFMKIWKAV